MLIIAGLVLIILGWIAQLVKIRLSNQKTLSGVLLVPYALGCILMAIGGYLSSDWLTAGLNTACALVPLVIAAMIVKE